MVERRAVSVHGTVQGVGFRPFVFALAKRRQLTGFVRNDGGRVLIEVEGDSRLLEDFLEDLQSHPPPLARIDSIRWWRVVLRGDRDFCVESSNQGLAKCISVSPDIATCDECLTELFDLNDRRYRYPFINCTNCGPRLTIIRGVPYDRERTTMAGFAMCDACRKEYEDPSNRRFHAQPIACPDCGPCLAARQPNGELIDTRDPLLHFAEVLRRGGIGAAKGLGGYHLVCDAGSERAVTELRHRKHRDAKPLAVMVRDLATAEILCELNLQERELLESPQRPIVLLRRQRNIGDKVCEAVAPRSPWLGIMLPYTPLHHLLMHAVAGAVLVLTSGNLSDEPIACRDDDAIERLGQIADVILSHDRPIHVRCDDSVTRCVGSQELLLRRSRGYAPRPLQLVLPCQGSILAVGGQLKNVFALSSGNSAILSHHLGDLDHLEAYRQFQSDIKLYEQLFQVKPVSLVHDLHPEYSSTVYARQRAADEDLTTIAVQHHHAHMASCMAEHGLNEPVIGVAFDGTGFGIDEATHEPVVWGGEFLIGDYRHFRRAARLRYVLMPGGDMAAKEPWRMAVAHLLDAGCGTELLADRIPATHLRNIESMLKHSVNSPLTSSAGRLFDAVAAIAGIRDVNEFEGQAAMEVESFATETCPDIHYSYEINCSLDQDIPHIIDTRPVVRAVAADALVGVPATTIARRFHSTLVAMIADVCAHVAKQTNLTKVVLSGGVFLNALLTHEVVEHLTCVGLRVYRQRLVPPNDGGLCLGQLAVAAAHF